MSLSSGFFNSYSGDRAYDATDFSRYLEGLVTNGCLPNDTGLKVVPNPEDVGSPPSVIIKPGKAYYNGLWFRNSDDYIYNLTPTITPDVFHLIYVCFDITENGRDAYFLHQTGPNPILPDNANGKYYMPLCRIADQLGGLILETHITDLRWYAGVSGTGIVTASLVDSAITTPKIANGAVDTDKIKPGAVTHSLIADDAVGINKIINSAVISSKIGDGAVTAVKLSTSAVTNGKLATDSVSESKILNGAVTTNKIKDEAVEFAKIKPGAVTYTRIGNNAVGADKLGSNIFRPQGVNAYHWSNTIDNVIFNSTGGDHTKYTHTSAMPRLLGVTCDRNQLMLFSGEVTVDYDAASGTPLISAAIINTTSSSFANSDANIVRTLGSVRLPEGGSLRRVTIPITGSIYLTKGVTYNLRLGIGSSVEGIHTMVGYRTHVTSIVFPTGNF